MGLSDPFRPFVKNGRLYCRGVANNLGPLVIRIGTLNDLASGDGQSLPVLCWIIQWQEKISSLFAHGEQSAACAALRTLALAARLAALTLTARLDPPPSPPTPPPTPPCRHGRFRLPARRAISNSRLELPTDTPVA